MQLTHPHSTVGVHHILHPTGDHELTGGNYSSCLTLVTDTQVKLGEKQLPNWKELEAHRALLGYKNLHSWKHFFPKLPIKGHYLSAYQV